MVIDGYYRHFPVLLLPSSIRGIETQIHVCLCMHRPMTPKQSGHAWLSPGGSVLYLFIIFNTLEAQRARQKGLRSSKNVYVKLVKNATKNQQTKVTILRFTVTWQTANATASLSQSEQRRRTT